MKTLTTCAAILCGFLMHSAQGATQKFKLDIEKSSVKWAGNFMEKQVTARAKFKSGKMSLADSAIQSGEVVADMKSITSDSGLDDQIKGDAMLNVARYPTATFKIKTFTELHSITPDGPNARVTGTVTFKGKAHAVTGDFVMKPEGKGFHATGKFPTTYTKIVDGEASFDLYLK